MEVALNRRILRWTIFCIVGSLFCTFIYFNLLFNGPDHEERQIVRAKEDSHQPVYSVEEPSADEKQLRSLKISKIGGDSSNSGPNAKHFHQDLGACKIPMLDVNGTEIAPFYKKFPPLDCANGKPKAWLFIDDQRRIQATEYAEKKFGIEKLNCSLAFYDRLNDRQLVWTPRKSFSIGDLVELGDYFKVDCIADGQEWGNPFMVAVPQKDRVERMKSLNAAHRSRSNANQSLNVYMLSFDSLSQMSFRRNLPKTVKFIEEEIGSVVLNGYNIVGDGTPQAFIPILTGQTEEELPLTRKRFKQASYVDEVYPFVWNNFSDAGYSTLYGEDGHDFGTFTYRLKGFRKNPTDHFPITFFHYTEQLNDQKQCIRAEKQHVVCFRYIESFWREYAKLGIPRFSLLHHSYLSHDDINRVQQADEDLVTHLQRMRDLGALENTLFIVMADHGARFSALRETQQGQLEERLPFVSIHLPNLDKLHKKAKENLRKNALDRLTTPFDMHATLLDSIRWPLTLEEINSPNQLPQGQTIPKGKNNPRPSPPNRSLSLFREIPLNRTCDQAGIEAHWCTCLNWKTVSNEADEARILAKAVVSLINDYTEPERSLCASLKLHRVEKAKKLVPNDNLLKYSGVLDSDGFKPKIDGKLQAKFATFQIVFETRPGSAKYEVTLFYDGQQVIVDWTAISHINQYGSAPHCIIDKNYFLATYCVCYDKIAEIL